MLLEIRKYLQEHGAASILDLSNRFRISPDALRGMLDHWVRKGTVSRRDFAGDCGGCTSQGHCCGCGTLASFEVYEWTGARG